MLVNSEDFSFDNPKAKCRIWSNQQYETKRLEFSARIKKRKAPNVQPVHQLFALNC